MHTSYTYQQCQIRSFSYPVFGSRFHSCFTLFILLSIWISFLTDLLKKQVFVALKWRTNGARALFAGLVCGAEPVYWICVQCAQKHQCPENKPDNHWDQKVISSRSLLPVNQWHVPSSFCLTIQCPPRRSHRSCSLLITLRTCGGFV